MAYEEIPASKLQIGDIICTPGIRPGQVTQLSFNEPYIVWEDVDNSGVKHIRRYRPWVPVRVYRGDYAEAIGEWTQKHGTEEQKGYLLFDRPLYYILDEQGIPQPATDDAEGRHAAHELLINVEKRRVGSTEKTVAGHEICVTTMFLVLDRSVSHATGGEAVLFETRLFVDKHEIESTVERYHTRQEAIEGHQRVTEAVERVLLQLGECNLDISEIAGLLAQ